MAEITKSDKFFHLEILSPEGTVFDGDVQSVDLPGAMGRFVVLPTHAPLISILVPGTLTYTTPDCRKTFNVGAGTMKVEDNHALVLVESSKEVQAPVQG